jgi:hypothetical protein
MAELLRDPDADLDQTLGILSSPAERLSALLRLGFKYDEIATALGVSSQSVRSWVDGGSLNATNEDCLDEFRAIALVLYQELGEAAVRSFLVSRPAPGERRPIDYIHTDPNSVGAAAMAEIRRRKSLATADAPSEGSEQLEGVPREIIEKARAHYVDPVDLPSEPAFPELADESVADMSRERRDWETGSPPKAA